MNLSLVVIIISIVLQFFSAAIAIRLIILNRNRKAGTIMLFAVVLMAFRRSISLYYLTTGKEIKVDLFSEIIACIISIMLLVGFIYLSRLIDVLYKEIDERKRTEDALRESQARFQAKAMKALLCRTWKDVM